MTTVTAYEAKTHLPRLIRAAEHGETVIITRHGKPVAQLGPVQNRTREEIAQVITYVRKAWGNTAGGVTKEQVAAIKKETEGRGGALWTVDELMKVQLKQ